MMVGSTTYYDHGEEEVGNKGGRSWVTVLRPVSGRLHGPVGTPLHEVLSLKCLHETFEERVPLISSVSISVPFTLLKPCVFLLSSLSPMIKLNISHFSSCPAYVGTSVVSYGRRRIKILQDCRKTSSRTSKIYTVWYDCDVTPTMPATCYQELHASMKHQ